MDENLTEEERKRAWEEFEQEKKGFIQQRADPMMLQQMQAAQQMQSLNPMAIQAQLRAMYPEMSHEEVMARTRWTITQLQQRQLQQQEMQQQVLWRRAALWSGKPKFNSAAAIAAATIAAATTSAEDAGGAGQAGEAEVGVAASAAGLEAIYGTSHPAAAADGTTGQRGSHHSRR